MSAVNSGRTLFVGDVHGCVDELETLLATAQATRIVLLGDLFTKGPDAPAVWDCIRRVSAESVLGNQDARVLRLAEHERSVVPAEALHWLKQLPTHIEGPGWLAVHAG
ncbi:MAG: metallophosphoesterase family protein, partial [Myxococcota bacterium]|nr:metallophosphoesterase family protein [Myxococcota bacterium]